MSRLTDLLRSVESTDPQIAAELRKEITALTHNQRTFGLVYEKHQPEAVQLPEIKIRKGSKVNILPERGSTAKVDKQLWEVVSVNRDNPAAHVAQLVAINPAIEAPEDLPRAEALVENLVAVLEFHDRIFPGLIETGRVERGGDAPFHSVINAENFHALEMLTYTHRHKVDAIYIDPPYNTRAKDWKYNNDYVDSDDAYKHSKWLSFMERRLKLAKELLNPADSVLIVTIDEKEYLRLGMLLEQIFPEATVQMVSSVINPKGVSRSGFSRVDEYIFFVMLGTNEPSQLVLDEHWDLYPEADKEEPKNSSQKREGPGWTSMMRRGSNARRSDRESMFYPIWVDINTQKIDSVGDPLPLGKDRESVEKPREGVQAIWPMRQDGSEGRWQCSAAEVVARKAQGRIRLGRATSYGFVVNYLPKGEWEHIQNGLFDIEGYAEDGSIIAYLKIDEDKSRRAPTQWHLPAHNASENGSTLLRKFIPGRKFPFPKSLYAVEDTIRFFTADKPNALIVDFFAGSGTTAHAVMRLNKQDEGQRVSISITNNEVSADEQKALIKKNLRPGDHDWEQYGICDYVTKPRVTAAITGNTPEGEPVRGDYKFIDEFPMAEGFEANAVFFTLTYESSTRIRHNMAFRKIAPLLWLRAGSQGRIIHSLEENGWDIADNYAVIENLDRLTEFSHALRECSVSTVFIVTDDSGAFEMAVRSVPDGVETVRLYSSYLENFEINSGRSF